MRRYVAETIASVKAQTADGWECIIVDDGSGDGSGQLVRSLTAGDDRFIVIGWKRNRGVAAARNSAIHTIEGDEGYVLPLDADDRLLPHAIETFAKTWEAHPDASLLVPQIIRFDPQGHRQVQERVWNGYEDLKERCTPTNSSCFKLKDFYRVGGYRSWSMYEDWEFWLRLLYHNDRVVNINEPLVEYRIHGDSRWHKAVRNHDWEVSQIKRMNPQIFKK
jgi:glycosyltransferase involved in cell wall biosynthesis